MANTFLPVIPSGSTQGFPIKIAATATAGTTLHTTGTSATIIDEITVYAQNNHTADVDLTLEVGDATAPDHNVVVTAIPFKKGQVLIGVFRLSGSGSVAATLKAFASVANVISINAHVTRYTP